MYQAFDAAGNHGAVQATAADAAAAHPSPVVDVYQVERNPYADKDGLYPLHRTPYGARPMRFVNGKPVPFDY